MDHELMLAVRDGDVEKLGTLFEKHNRHLYNFFLKQTGSPALSEDFVQDVFLRMLKYRHTYRAEGKFITWMFSIAHNVKTDHYRRKKPGAKSIDERTDLPSLDPDPLESLEDKDRTERLSKALALLPEEKREVLLLSRYQDLKYEEIARILGCKVGTVKARVHYALKELTERYEELARDPQDEVS
jgi:RNA polymerase sigma-70 factor (ECF subfamily)